MKSARIAAGHRRQTASFISKSLRFSMLSHFFSKMIGTVSGYFSKRQFYEPGGYVEIWKIAWPLIILSASNTLMMIINRVFLAKNSPEEIAAAMPAGQMFFTLMALFLMLP